jgi:hypothetical protein
MPSADAPSSQNKPGITLKSSGLRGISWCLLTSQQAMNGAATTSFTSKISKNLGTCSACQSGSQSSDPRIRLPALSVLDLATAWNEIDNRKQTGRLNYEPGNDGHSLLPNLATEKKKIDVLYHQNGYFLSRLRSSVALRSMGVLLRSLGVCSGSLYPSRKPCM